MRDPGGGRDSYLDFDLPVLIRGALWLTLGYGVVLGILLAGPQVVATLNGPDMTPHKTIIVCVASVVLGLAAGILAFGLKTLV